MKVTECKTLSARIGQVQKGVPKFRKELQDLAGVDLLDANGELKSTYDILTELGAVWDNLDSLTKSQIGNDLFGKDNITTGYAILENYEKLTEVKATLDSSSGSVESEFARYLDSTSAKIEQFKATVTEKWSNLISSDMTKTVVEGATRLVDTFGNLGGAIQIATTALLVWKGSQISSAVQTALLAAKTVIYEASMAGASVTTTAMTLATTGLSTAMSSLSAVIATNPLGAIAVALTGAIALMSLAEKKVKSFEESMTSFNSALTSLKSVNAGEGQLEEIENLEAKLKDTNITIEERTELENKLLSLQNELASSVDGVTTYIDKEGKAYATNNELIRTQLQMKKDLANIELDQSYNDMKSSVLSDSESSKWLNRFLAPLTGNNEWLGSQITNLFGNDDINDYIELTEKMKEAEEGLGEGLDSEEVSRYNEVLTKFQEINQAVLQMKTNGKDISDKEMFDLETGEFIEATKWIEKYSNETEKVGEASSEASSKIMEMYESGASLEEIAGTLGMELEDVSAIIGDVGDSATTTTNNIKDLGNAFSELNSPIELLQKMKEEMAEFGYITSDTYKSVLTSGNSDLIALLADSGNFMANVDKTLDSYMTKRDQVAKQLIDTAYREVNGIGATTGAIQQQYSNVNTASQQAIQSVEALNNVVVRGGSQAMQQDVINFSDSVQKKILANAELRDALESTFVDYINSNSLNYGIDAENFIKALNTKNGQNAQWVNDVIKQVAQSINANSKNYGTDAQNWAKMVLSKDYNNSEMCTSINTSMAQALNAMLGQYQSDYSNFNKVVNEKLAMYNKFAQTVNNAISTAHLPTFNDNGMVVDERTGLWRLPTPDELNEINKAKTGRYPIANNIFKNNLNLQSSSGVKIGSSGSYVGAGGGHVKPSSSGGSGSSKTEKDYSVENLNLEDYIERHYKLENKIRDVKHQQELLSKEIENSYGKHKLDLQAQYVKKLEEEQRLTQELINSKKSDLWDKRVALDRFGIGFDVAGNITNMNEIYTKLINASNAINDSTEAGANQEKEAQQRIKDLKDTISSYTALQSEIQGLESEYKDLASTIDTVHRDITQAFSDLESDLASIIKDKVSEAIESQTEALDKLRDKINKQWEDDNWDDTKAEKEQDIIDLKSQLEDAMRVGNATQIKNLKKELENAQKEYSDLIKENEKENILNKIDEEKEKIENTKEEMLTNEQLSTMIQEAIQNGWVNIGGQVYETQKLMEEYTKSSVTGFESQKLALDDYIRSLETCMNYAVELNGINSNLGLINSVSYSTEMSRDIANALASANNSNNTARTVQFNSPLMNIDSLSNDVDVDSMVNKAYTMVLQAINNSL